jgi:hypothetical protein
MVNYIDETIAYAKKLVKEFFLDQGSFLPFVLINKNEIEIECLIDNFGLTGVYQIVDRYELLISQYLSSNKAISCLLVIDGVSSNKDYDGVIVMKLTYDAETWHIANFYYKYVIGELYFIPN